MICGNLKVYASKEVLKHRHNITCIENTQSLNKKGRWDSIPPSQSLVDSTEILCGQNAGTTANRVRQQNCNAAYTGVSIIFATV